MLTPPWSLIFGSVGCSLVKIIQKMYKRFLPALDCRNQFVIFSLWFCFPKWKIWALPVLTQSWKMFTEFIKICFGKSTSLCVQVVYDGFVAAGPLPCFLFPTLIPLGSVSQSSSFLLISHWGDQSSWGIREWEHLRALLWNTELFEGKMSYVSRL